MRMDFIFKKTWTNIYIFKPVITAVFSPAKTTAALKLGLIRFRRGLPSMRCCWCLPTIPISRLSAALILSAALCINEVPGSGARPTVVITRR